MVEEEQSLEHLVLAVEQRQQQPCIADSTERTQRSHLKCQYHGTRKWVSKLTISSIRISLTIGSVVLSVLSSIINSCNWTASSWSGWSCWAHDTAWGVGSR